MAKGSTSAVAKPTVKLSSVKIPNATKAAAPVVKTKVAKMKLNNSAQKLPKTTSPKNTPYVPPKPM